MLAYVLIIIAIALLFDFINGFHDSANAIATVVGTRVLGPLTAVFWAATFNFIALWAVGTAVAKTIGGGMIDVSVVTPSVILGGLIGAICWNLFTWYLGLPSSSSHALVGGYAGAAVARAGVASIIPGGWTKTLAFIVLSPLIGFFLGSAIMVVTFWLFHRVRPERVNRLFRGLQLASSALFALSHGANDAQKTMGIIVGLLVATNALFAAQTGVLSHLHLTTTNYIPFWVRVAAHAAIASGTLFGGWRIIHTMGSRITRLKPVGGFAAETGGALSILLATGFGIPVSTTHTISGSIVGVGTANRVRSVRWGIAGRLVWAWIFTIPTSAIIAAISYWILAWAVRL